MRWLRHLKMLLLEFWSFAWQRKAWWILPVILVLLLVTGIIMVSSGVAPFIYPLF